MKLKIIPVDNVGLPLVTEMQTKLDNIYKQAVTKVELGGGYIEGFTMGLNAPLEDLPSGWLSAYILEVAKFSAFRLRSMH